MKHKEVFMLPNANLWLKKIPLIEISNVSGVVYHRTLSLIPCQEPITTLLDLAMKELEDSLPIVSR